MTQTEDRFKYLKFRLPEIETLAMLKMEKNFIAHIEKGYPRQPYNDKNQSVKFFIERIEDELAELKDGLQTMDIQNMMEECADISNVVDYLFEKLVREKRSLI